MQISLWKPLLLSAAALAIVYSTAIALGNNQAPNLNKTVKDTLPAKEKKKQLPTVIAGDLDAIIKDLDKTLAQLHLEFSDAKIEKLRAEMESNLAALNNTHIEKEMSKALKALEEEKIVLKKQEALNSINIEKMQVDVDKALKEVRTASERKQLETELKKALSEIKKIDTKEIELQLEKAREEILQQKEHLRLDMEKAREEIQKELSTNNLKEEMNKARIEIEAAKEEITSYKKLIQALEKDGLLKTGENYVVEYDNGILTINGKRQQEAISNKYKNYFRKDKIRLQKESNFVYKNKVDKEE
jgi:DNA repair exonuclease SbcCD ATPase subunit